MRTTMADQESMPEREGKTPRESMTVLAESMMPDQLNHHGNVFGGVILALVDKCGGVVARRHARLPVVTVSIDRVEFNLPVYASDFVEARGRIVYAGRTSMDVLVTATAEQVESGVRRQTNRCMLTYVALDRLNGCLMIPPPGDLGLSQPLGQHEKVPGNQRPPRQETIANPLHRHSVDPGRESSYAMVRHRPSPDKW